MLPLGGTSWNNYIFKFISRSSVSIYMIILFLDNAFLNKATHINHINHGNYQEKLLTVHNACVLKCKEQLKHIKLLIMSSKYTPKRCYYYTALNQSPYKLANKKNLRIISAFKVFVKYSFATFTFLFNSQCSIILVSSDDPSSIQPLH